MVTASQAALLSAACQELANQILNDPEPTPVNVDALYESVLGMRDLFKDVADNPTAYANGELLKTLKRLRKAQKQLGSS